MPELRTLLLMMIVVGVMGANQPSEDRLELLTALLLVCLYCTNDAISVLSVWNIV